MTDTWTDARKAGGYLHSSARSASDRSGMLWCWKRLPASLVAADWFAEAQAAYLFTGGGMPQHRDMQLRAAACLQGGGFVL